MGKNVAITGAAGYIGRMLIDRLATNPDVDRIVAIDLAPLDPLPPKTEFAQLDVRDPLIERAFTGCDTIIHLAFVVSAINDLKTTYSVNLGGTRNVLSACETNDGLTKLIAASSLAAYGVQPKNNSVITEDTPLRGDSTSYYLHTKRLMEEDVVVFEKRNPHVIVTRLRPSILLGPNNTHFSQEMGNFPFDVNVREGACLPIVHEEDVIDAFELALDRDAPGAFNVTLNEPVTLADFAPSHDKRTINVRINSLKKLSRVLYALRLTKLSPDWIVSAEGAWRADNARAREVLGWTPKHDRQAVIDQMITIMKGGKTK